MLITYALKSGYSIDFLTLKLDLSYPMVLLINHYRTFGKLLFICTFAV